MPSDTWTAPADWTTNEVVTAAKLNQQLRDNIYALWLAVTTGSAAITEMFSSGTYTPTLTNGTNVAASTAFECQWMRIGSVVCVSGKVNLDPTSANTTTILGISLPVASNFGAEEDLGGVTAATAGVTDSPGRVYANIASDRAEVSVWPGSAANQGVSFIFQYQVI